MRLISTAFLTLLLVAVSCGQTYYGSTDLKLFREGRDKEFRNVAESPLLEADLKNFNGLKYFKVDRKFRVTARLTKTDGAKYFLMPTSTGKPKKFRQFGVLKFRLAGQSLQLSVYQADTGSLKTFPEYADLLFIPFRDRTNGNETYGGGRYIDIRAPKNGRVKLDFNLAYSPNCAYGSDRYSCPIPPSENKLAVQIRAGEKKFFDSK